MKIRIEMSERIAQSVGWVRRGSNRGSASTRMRILRASDARKRIGLV